MLKMMMKKENKDEDWCGMLPACVEASTITNQGCSDGNWTPLCEGKASGPTSHQHYITTLSLNSAVTI